MDGSDLQKVGSLCPPSTAVSQCLGYTPGVLADPSMAASLELISASLLSDPCPSLTPLTVLFQKCTVVVNFAD